MALGGALGFAFHPEPCVADLQRDTDTPLPQTEAGSQGSSADADEFGAAQLSANTWCDPASTAFHTNGAPFDDSANDSSAVIRGAGAGKPQFHSLNSRR
ncbi:hypothetical protein DL771_000193 [Monosporascus sp. 5C6A]|nr:hypothetical protein DL771_000193 [Monosporascus sp. 5C6A]